MNRRRFTELMVAAPVSIGAVSSIAFAQTPEATLLEFATGPTIGESGAPVDMHIYSDFQASFCQEFHFDVLPHIASDFVITGLVKITFHDFPRLGTDASIADPDNLEVELRDPDNESSMAAQAAMCAGDQGRYLEMSNMLFSRLSGVQQSVFYRSTLSRMAELLGLNMKEFNDSMDSGRHIPALVASIEHGQANGITGVPMFILDNGNGDPNVIQQTVEGYNLLKKQIEVSISAAP